MRLQPRRRRRIERVAGFLERIERIGVLTIIWALIGYFSIFDFGLGRAITQRIASLASHQTDRQKKKKRQKKK